MDSNHIQQNKQIYNLYTAEYEQYYFDDQTGGFILIHQQHNLNPSELFIAEAFAKQGNQVKLLQEQAQIGEKTPDAKINNEEWEFKELSPNAVNIKNRVQRGIATAKKQAPNIAYHINNDRANLQDINRGIIRALVWDIEGNIQKIALVFQNGTINSLNREQLDNGEYFR